MNLFEKPLLKTHFIDSLQSGENVNWYYRVQEIVKKKTKNGDDFLDLTVMDKSGRMPAKIWNNVGEYYKLIQAGEIYKISGDIKDYKGKKQITVNHLRVIAASDKDFNPADYNEIPPFDTAALLKQMFSLLAANLTNPHLLQLVEFFKVEYGPILQQAYGAQKIHHAYSGGLLQHTYSVLEMALALAPHYGLDKELLLIGALFHDIGKTAEFKTQPSLETTLEGGLLGHVVISLTIFLDLKNRIADFPAALSTNIQHLILSHHGEKEYGAPEVPKTPEAYLLHLLDLLDSRMNIFSEQLKSGDGQKLFSEFNQALGTRILLAKE
jgi:3'-5' exoribonuclease